MCEVGEGGSAREREEGKDGGWRKRRRERVRECVYGQEREEGRLGGKGLGRVEEKDGGWRKEHSTWGMRRATKELSTYHCLVTQSPGSSRS